MPRSAGTYSLPAGNPVVSGTVISSAVQNTTMNDIAAELTNSLPRDGSAPPTGPIPMGGYKLTGLANGTNAQDAATWGQLSAFLGTSIFQYLSPAQIADVQARTETLDTAAAIQAAIDAVALQGGGRIFFPRGIYRVDSTINRKAHVLLMGEARGATEIHGTGNFNVIESVGTIVSVINGGGTEKIRVRGAGKTNLSCNGIHEKYTNRSTHRDIEIFSCRNAMYTSNVWQVTLDNVHGHGAGSDQNYNGLYAAEVDPANQNNAMNVINCTFQDVENVGWRMINFNGSKFANCEGLNGVSGFSLGAPTTGSERIRWGNFVNCLADTNSGNGWHIERGSATALEQIQFANCWSGSSGLDGWYIANGSQITINGAMVINSGNSAMNIIGSNRLALAGNMMDGYDQGLTAKPGINANQLTYSQVVGNHMYPVVPSTGQSYFEYNGADNNTVVANNMQNGFTRQGANTTISRASSVYSERAGSATIAAAATSVVVTHGLPYTPSNDDIFVKFQNFTGSAATKLKVNTITSTQFTIVCDVPPTLDVVVTWSVDPLLK